MNNLINIVDNLTNKFVNMNNLTNILRNINNLINKNNNKYFGKI
jgi:hypothetical protein